MTLQTSIDCFEETLNEIARTLTEARRQTSTPHREYTAAVRFLDHACLSMLDVVFASREPDLPTPCLVTDLPHWEAELDLREARRHCVLPVGGQSRWIEIDAQLTTALAFARFAIKTIRGIEGFGLTEQAS